MLSIVISSGHLGLRGWTINKFIDNLFIKIPLNGGKNEKIRYVSL